MSMNVSFLFSSLLKLSLSKRVQKYNFFLLWQVLLKIIFSFYFLGNLLMILKNLLPFVSMFPGRQRYNRILFLANVFYKFFNLFSVPYQYLRENVCCDAGAKVIHKYSSHKLCNGFFV